MSTPLRVSIFIAAAMLLSAAQGQQTPSIVWQHCLGGSGLDEVEASVNTNDSGFVLVGSTGSFDGDVSGNHGGTDIWVVRLDAQGGIIWQKALGGDDEDLGTGAAACVDGGFFVAGHTTSTDGDVDGNHGDMDGWLVKLDANGAIVWQACLGGSEEDKLYAVVALADGGCLVAGAATSNDGDVSGNHGALDGWVARVDAAGQLVWQQCVGGSAVDSFRGISLASDDGYYLTGHSASDNGDVSGGHGGSDLWLVRIADGGALTWQRMLGGSNSEQGDAVRTTNDGGCIVAGRTSSSNGDVTVAQGLLNVWLVKLDATGDMDWQHTYGSTGMDWAEDLQVIANGYVFIARVAEGDVDVEGWMGGDDAWAVQVDATGDMVWQSTLGTSTNDEGRALLRTMDGGYLVSAMVSSNGGDVSGFQGGTDFWVAKLLADDVAVEETPSEVRDIRYILNGRSLLLQLPAENAAWTVQLSDALGRLHTTRTARPGAFTLDLATWPAGAYQVLVRSGKTERVFKVMLD